MIRADRVLFHVFGHVEAEAWPGIVVEQEFDASAFDSSVLPTPVGPRNRNDPIGRFGSCNPARARRTAFETARTTASSWPTTRLATMLCPPCRSNLWPLPLQHLVDRDARPAADDPASDLRARCTSSFSMRLEAIFSCCEAISACAAGRVSRCRSVPRRPREIAAYAAPAPSRCARTLDPPPSGVGRPALICSFSACQADRSWRPSDSFSSP